MPSNEIHKNDVGTVIQATIKDGDTVVDLTDGTMTFMFKKPTGATVEKSGVLTTDGTDGKVQYTTETGFLDIVGTWNFQVKIVSDTNTWYSDITTFKVYRNVG